MAPHLVRARSAYKDIRIRLIFLCLSVTHTHTHTHTLTHSLSLTHTHTHTHSHTHTLSLTLTLQIHALVVMGWYNEKKENDRSVCRRVSYLFTELLYTLFQGKVIGVAIGCFLGMCPLLLFPKDREKEKEEKSTVKADEKPSAPS